MPFSFDSTAVCPTCPYGVCVEDRRVNRVSNRATRFRLKQTVAMACTFSDFVPGTDNDPNFARTVDDYLNQFRANAVAAGTLLFGHEFAFQSAALAKVEGDVLELVEAAALWNAFAVWNEFMDTAVWNSSAFSAPEGAVPTPTRKAAAVKLPRGYDTTRLFKPEIRNSILAHESALRLRGMELGLSAPDIVGVRIPDPITDAYRPFLTPLANLGDTSRYLLEDVHRAIEGTLDGFSFLFAIAVKRTTRSDRLYQPLFESNVLKYLIGVVLRGAAFRFYVHMASFAGADVEQHYKAASLVSLLRGGEPQRAVDGVLQMGGPRHAAQTVLNDLPLFPQ
jgi:hypothetical protein